jgi:hypothetical protein
MADITEKVPTGVVSDGNGRVVFVKTLADPSAPKATELNSSTSGAVVPLTYSITGDGYTHNITINKVTANRLTLPTQLQYDGTEVDELSIKYAYTNTASDVVRLALPKGTTGYIVERWAVANGAEYAADQLVTVIPITASVSLPDAPVTNQELTRTQALNVSGKVWRDVKVA